MRRSLVLLSHAVPTGLRQSYRNHGASAPPAGRPSRYTQTVAGRPAALNRRLRSACSAATFVEVAIGEVWPVPRGQVERHAERVLAQSLTGALWFTVRPKPTVSSAVTQSSMSRQTSPSP